MTLALDGIAPRSRSTDPTTSVDAGRAADLNKSQQYVLSLFNRWGRPLADHELVDHAVFGDRSRYSPQRLRSARAELTEAGLIELTDIERRTRSGKRAQVWALTKWGVTTWQ